MLIFSRAVLDRHNTCFLINLPTLIFLLGKIAIKKEDLSIYSGKETWFILQPVDSNSEVQVKLNKHEN